MRSGVRNRIIALLVTNAVVLAALAALAFARPMAVDVPVLYLFLAAAMVVASTQVSQLAFNSQKQIERLERDVHALELSLDQQRSAIDAFADGLDIAILVCDARAQIVYTNLRANQMFRFANTAGRMVIAVTLNVELEQMVLRVADTGTAEEREMRFAYPQDRTIIARAWCPEGRGGRVFLSLLDITELRRLERIRTDFVANVSHELRTPMQIIRLKAETMLDDEPPEDTARALRTIIGEVDRLSTITQDLLILSTAESNPVRKQACDLAATYRSVMAQLEQKASLKGLEVELEAPDSLLIAANLNQMTQVAINLVDNAINYTAEGGVKVQVSAQGDQAVIRVTDSGIGIASDHLPRIFERFYRVDKARSRVTGGTGLGLSIVKHIVEAHGGTVLVESELNRGTTFTVTLPIGTPAASEPAPEPAP